MIKLLSVHFPSRTLLLVVSEALLTFGALVAATYIRFQRDTPIVLLYERNGWTLLLTVFVCIISMHYFDLYDSGILRNRADAITRLVQSIGTVSLVLASLFYLFPDIRVDRALLLLGITSIGIVLAAWRFLFGVIQQHSKFSDRVLFVGDGPLLPALAQECANRPEFGLTPAGYVNSCVCPREPATHIPYLGPTTDLSALVDTENIQRIVLTMADRRGKLPVMELLALKSQGVCVDDGVELYESITGRIALNALHPSWLLFSPGFHLSPAMRLYKRIAAICGSVVGLLIALPLMAVAAVAIRLDSPGPIIFKQRRIGYGGRVFTCLKFRTMREHADGDGRPRPAAENDARITRVGRILRRFRIDELPQLINILRGDMNFVGPRPFPPTLEAEYAAQIPFYEQRWNVTPGATGWAQIHKGYCASTEDNVEKLAYDLFYIRHLSPGLDLVILFETVKILLLGRGAR
jgi:sugar transferase (PEP-CTERM system associated)